MCATAHQKPEKAGAVEANQIQPLLFANGLSNLPMRAIIGGWSSWTFDIGGEYILRIARTDEIAQCHRKEARLLPVLADAVEFEVPAPIRTGTHRGYEYMLYRKLAGRAFDAGDDLATLGRTLQQLHGFDPSTAASLTGGDASPAAWQQRYQQIWEWVDVDVMPHLDAALQQQVASRYRRMMKSVEDMVPTFVHADLGTEHILVNDRNGEVRAIIDFETATVGDPAIDFVGILASLGRDATTEVMAAYGSHIPWDRLHFYWWMGSVHAVKYGVEQNDRGIIADGIAGLRKRMRAIAHWDAAAIPRADSGR